MIKKGGFLNFKLKIIKFINSSSIYQLLEILKLHG